MVLIVLLPSSMFPHTSYTFYILLFRSFPIIKNNVEISFILTDFFKKNLCIQVEQNRNEAYLKHTCSISIRNEKLMTKQTTYHNVFLG